MMRWHFPVALVLWLGVLLVACEDQAPLNRASVAELASADIQYHVNYLASDALEGRLAGTPGSEAAARYVSSEFKRFGLAPLGDQQGFRQEMEFVGDVELGKQNQLQTRRPGADTTWTLVKHFMPAGFSASGSAAAGVVFAGYGIVAKNMNYDDYAGVDVTGRVALVLRYSPASADPHAGFGRFEAVRYKAMQAREHGAAALLIVTPPDSSQTALPKPRYDRAAGDAGLPVMFVTREVTGWLLAGSGRSLDSLEAAINASRQPASFELDSVTVSLQAEVNKIRRRSANLIGMLPGSDPALREQAVIIGAHYDHLGRSSAGALDPEIENEIRNGADDNASGTAGVLELAQYFAAREQRPRRSLIFMAFAAEELGLVGSGHYVNNPTFPLDKTVAMINMDMIGRLKDSVLVIQGVGTSPALQTFVERHNAEGRFKLNLKKDGAGPSDHSSFYQKNIPVLFFFTGLHEDYHRVSDDADKINAAGQADILKLAANIVTEIANSDSVPLFTKVESDERREARAFRVSAGTIPDYAAEVEGLKLSGVRAGGPAERAGLLAGDIIVRFGNFEIKNIYDYTYALGEFAPGQEVEVIVMRGSEKMTFTLKLDPARRM